MPQSRKDLLDRLACKAQIDRVRAKIQVARPSQRAIVGDSNLLEQSRLQPSFKYSHTSVVGKIDDAADPVVESNLETISTNCFCFGDFHFLSLLTLQKQAVNRKRPCRSMTAVALEKRIDKRRGFGATKNDQCANQQEHNNDRRNKVGLVRQDEVEQLGDEGTAAHEGEAKG